MAIQAPGVLFGFMLIGLAFVAACGSAESNFPSGGTGGDGGSGCGLNGLAGTGGGAQASDASAGGTSSGGGAAGAACTTLRSIADSTDDLGLPYAQLHAGGVNLFNVYFAWRDIEPSLGVYTWENLDEAMVPAQANSMQAVLEIEITNTDCVDQGMTDAECTGPTMPDDSGFSRTGQAFADPAMRNRIAEMVAAIIQRYPSSVLGYVYVGNEVDDYIRVVQQTNGIDLMDGFVGLLSAVQTRVNQVSAPRALFGTVADFVPIADTQDLLAKACSVVDIVGMTMYPTEPGNGETGPYPERLGRWFDTASATSPGGCGRAITEIGASALSPFGSDDDQQSFAQALAGALAARPGVFRYAGWFSMYDNSDMQGTVYEGMGLMTRDKVARPAYSVWVTN